MDFGDGVTVNLCRAVDCRNGDNGPKLTIPKSPGLQLEVHSNQDDARPADNVQVTLLHPKSREMLAEMQSSIQSVGDDSNSSGDIVMVNSNDCNRRMQSTFENKENIPNNETFIPLKKNTEDAVFHTSLNEPIGPILKSAMETKLDPDIKVPKEQQSPNKPTYLQHRESISCGIEESTEVLLVNSSECDDKYFGKGRAYSGTDSDIEVLMSEEIVDSDWSAGNTATDELEKAPVENIGAVIVENAPKMCTQNQVNLSKIVNESTDQEISVGNSSCSSLSNSEQTGKDQLLKVIGEQATYIQSLESTISRYRKTYKTLLEHVDALRLALDVKNIEDGNVKLEANGVDKPPGSRVVINHN